MVWSVYIYIKYILGAEPVMDTQLMVLGTEYGVGTIYVIY